MKKLHIVTALTSLLCCSCAYMQTNKNIREADVQYEGCKLDADRLALCRKGSKWYLSADVEKFTKHYPVFHDSILLADNNAPQYREVESTEPMVCYLPISAGTAATLQMKEGYANAEDLAGEITRLMQDTPVLYAPQMGRPARHAITAQIEESEKPVILTFKQSGEPSFTRRALATADFVLVDIPGTVAYNVAIPVMAPFIFFSEFLNNED